jgi:hypothetical protein
LGKNGRRHTCFDVAIRNGRIGEQVARGVALQDNRQGSSLLNYRSFSFEVMPLSQPFLHFPRQCPREYILTRL